GQHPRVPRRASPAGISSRTRTLIPPIWSSGSARRTHTIEWCNTRAARALTFNVIQPTLFTWRSLYLTPMAVRQLHRLPGGMVRRIDEVLERLEHWPDVSGAKPLRGKLK